MRLFQSLPSRAAEFYQDLLVFPWKNTALTLRERFREDRLGLTASSLTFTTTIALVPLITVALALRVWLSALAAWLRGSPASAASASLMSGRLAWLRSERTLFWVGVVLLL